MSNTQAVATRPAVLGDLVPGRLVRDIALVVGAAVFVGIAAQVSVPIPGTPVPVSGQTFAVLLSGAALGLGRGAASMVLYALAGMVGVPWFAQGASGWHMASFGYILGFVLAGAVVGALAARGGDRSPLRTVGTMAVGLAVIYAVGVPWLMAWTHSDLGGALSMGVRPFLIGDAIKVALAAGLLPGAWRLLRR
ncbi:biotin transporter BioY [Actinoallomurus purpureus]|uniref:biotin transporter BioY n=1 Tax=Actinoallomurus purpureus TaxID=478114 RepID=UPI002093E635|nr:biotin transporter BioY [Actinoallomurus purpureus]MCO6009356.1 biotin transporter BioY [Actinoallomurus purpureus]